MVTPWARSQTFDILDVVTTTFFILWLKHSLSGICVWQGQVFDVFDEDPKLKTLSVKILVGNAKVWIIRLLYSLGAGFLGAQSKVQSLNSSSSLFQFMWTKVPKRSKVVYINSYEFGLANLWLMLWTLNFMVHQTLFFNESSSPCYKSISPLNYVKNTKAWFLWYILMVYDLSDVF